MAIADITQAKLARSMWDRYKQDFLPIMEGMSSDLRTGRRAQESMSLVPENIESSFDLQQANRQSQLERIGVDSSLSNTAETQTGLAKAKAQTSAENELRLFNKDLRDRTVMGAASSMGSELSGGKK